MMSDVGDHHGVGIALIGLGVAEHFRGNVDEPHRLIAEAQVQLREGTGGQGLSWALPNSPVDTRSSELLRYISVPRISYVPDRQVGSYGHSGWRCLT
jgi:hypothetical protein